MPATALKIIQTASQRLLLPVPNSAAGSQDAQAAQLFAILNQFPEDLMTRRSAWFESTFVIDGADPTLRKCYATKDADIVDTPQALPTQWVVWKWKSSKGLEYAEDFGAYERLVGMFWLGTLPKDVIYIGDGGHSYEVHEPRGRYLNPGLVVPGAL